MWREIPAHHHHHYHHDLGGQSHLLARYPTPPCPLPRYIPEMNSAETLELYSSPQTNTMQQIDWNVEEENTSSFGTHKQGLVRYFHSGFWRSCLMYGIFSLLPFVRAVKHSCQKHVMTSSRTSLPCPASGSLLASITTTSKL